MSKVKTSKSTPPATTPVKRGRGRPTKLTPEIARKILEALRAGNYRKTSCLYAGVAYPTFARWLVLAQAQKRGKYRDFLDAVDEAEASAEVALVAYWRSQVPDNWQASRDMLARRYPERWGNRERVDVGLAEKSDSELLDFIATRIGGTSDGAQNSREPGTIAASASADSTTARE